MRDFANAQRVWYPTWPSNVEDRAMIVYVCLLLFSVFFLFQVAYCVVCLIGIMSRCGNIAKVEYLGFLGLFDAI